MAERGEAGGRGRSAGPPPRAPGDPERVGPYQILGRLGAGGMGMVFLGRAGDGARVAVKVLRPELAGDPAFLRMFRHEVTAARRVVGFCTARVLDADLSGPLPYLVTEFVEGVRLDRAIAASGRLSATDLEGLAVGVAAALTAIHGAGVVHRDLKPSNVLLSYFGPKVIDFGIARALDASATTATGKLMGSPGWMAPEQFAREPVTAAVDIFVWGSLVAYAGTGRRPFGEGTVVEIVQRLRYERPDLQGLEGRLRALVESCMAKQPERRPSAKTVLLELLGDHADPDPQASVTQLLQERWSPPAAASSAGGGGQPDASPPPVGYAPPPGDPAPEGEGEARPATGPAPATPSPSPPPPPATRPPPATPAPSAPPAPASRPARRRRRWPALLGLAAAAAVALLLLRPEPVGRPPDQTTTPAASRPATTATPTRPPPLCELLGDLGVDGELGPPSADRGFSSPAGAAGGWLPEPAALAVALGDHQLQSGCTRTWSPPAGPVAALFQFPSRTDALAMRGQLRDALAERGVRPERVPEVTGGELYLLEPGGGNGQLVMFVCNERVLQLHLRAPGSTPDPRLVRLAQGANRRLHERTGCPL